MFTGIIEEVGKLKSVTHGADSARLFIEAAAVMEGTAIGDSIAVNGVCLTVTELFPFAFSADVMSETLKRSTLGTLAAGSSVNLERALQVGGRLGGHIVSGHIDGTGKIIKKQKMDIALIFTFQTAPKLMRFIVEKGSIAIDGISLTVAETAENEFSISAIPHTLENTTLKTKNVGSSVNLETDIIGKYVEKLIRGEADNECSDGTLSESFLFEHGFV